MPLVELIVPQAPTNVPAFLAKLWRMVDTGDTDEYICWSEDGSSFRIRDQSQFASAVLPYYYKHSNMASFIRQLNMYGFHKVIALHSGNLKSDKEEIEFAHAFFLRGQEFLLDQIKRKSTSKSQNNAQQTSSTVNSPATTVKQEPVIITKVDTPDKEELVNEFLIEMSQMKERQDEMDNKMENMRNENEALWGEVLGLRQKHSQQQKIVEKLIKFLVALVQPRIGKGVKRKLRQPSFPSHKLAQTSHNALTAEGSPPSPKEAKVEEITEVIEEVHLSSSPPSTSEFIEDESDQMTESKYTMVDPASITPTIQQIKTDKLTEQLDLTSPTSSSLMFDVKKTDLEFDFKTPELDLDIAMQKELDSLKDILSGSGQINYDSSFMSGILSASSEGNNDVFPSPMKLFTDTMMSTPSTDEVSRVPDPDPYEAAGILTYDSSFNSTLLDSNMSSSSILTMAAESSGINLEEDLLTTPSKHTFDMDMDMDLDN